jgi:RHH-type transcriptional regulator, proline utilization regulon repressor / proline dehydrogenase / delta 1-pyrroline-5-carboxylate dehydrogenase
MSPTDVSSSNNAQSIDNPYSGTLPSQAVQLAAEILQTSRMRATRVDKQRAELMARMMDDPAGKKFTIAMADQVLRIKNPVRAARRMNSLVEQYGVPQYFSGTDRMAVRLGNRMAGMLPRLVIPQVKSKVRRDSKHVIISAEDQEFQKYLAMRRSTSVRINFNQLGEAVLGNHEADRRLHDNIQRLLQSGIDYISVKLSAVFSQINLVGYDQTKESIKPRLRELYRAAIKGATSSSTGQPKFVNLDMEEYRDLQLTVDVFKSVLEEPEFESLAAGIVLQAYLPDSFEVQKSLTSWALERFQKTGAEIKIRLVKGANLAMEQVEASLRDWEQAPYHSKLQVDANFKRMLEFATRPENALAVKLGVGSHNLFDIACAILLRDQRGISDRVEFEMLEGMANAQALVIREKTGDCLVYAPVVLDAEFESAVAYLVRRLDENTAPGSFLGDLFSLTEGSPAWKRQQEAFLQACHLATDPGLPSGSNRDQNRLTETPQMMERDFHNVADTDFSLPANRQWARDIFQRWQNRPLDPIPLQIAGEYLHPNQSGIGKDPSRPGFEPYRFAQADAEHVQRALQVAEQAYPAWDGAGVDHRSQILKRAAVILARQRGETIGSMLVDAGKNLVQADVEVSEAIDFANYYAHGLDHSGWHDGTSHRALGVVVVTPPWNFPYAIPAGGVLAALAAGNAVILKPARETVLVAWQLVEQLWEAGVPKDVLQFVPTVDGATGKALVSDPRVGAVILTGSIFTAQLFQSWRPEMKLFAETSGKNAMIVTAAADLDLAIKDIVYGAFGHAGQKCSATSLALVEKEVYDDPRFFAQLKDAAESWKVAGSWDPSAMVTPVQRPPDETLQRGLDTLDDGESWLLEPQMVDDNPCLWRPGIRIGVKPGSWYHQNECFGPVLGVIRVEDFQEALKIQNSSDFGLTGGLYSLDPLEIREWRDKVQVGNAYINRSTTGAIVRRQPFGGWKDSCVGPGAKAGGPNYVATLCHWIQEKLPEKRIATPGAVAVATKQLEGLLSDLDDRQALLASAESYAYWWQHEFSISHDPSQIHGETNEFRYRLRPWHLVRIQQPVEMGYPLAVAQTVLACLTTGVKLEISLSQANPEIDRIAQIAGVTPRIETDEQLARRLREKHLQETKGGSMRILGDYDPHEFAPAVIGNIPLMNPQVFANGRLELLNYLKEQSMTQIVHRYGNIV